MAKHVGNSRREPSALTEIREGLEDKEVEPLYPVTKEPDTLQPEAATKPRRKHRVGATKVSTNHRVTYHFHSGALHLARAVVLRVIKPRRKWITCGILCPVCGFHPNEVAKDMTRQAIEAIGHKKP